MQRELQPKKAEGRRKRSLDVAERYSEANDKLRKITMEAVAMLEKTTEEGRKKRNENKS